MDANSNRYQKWIEPKWHELFPAGNGKQIIAPAKFVVWIHGPHALYDGDMLGLASLNFIDPVMGFGDFTIQVDSPDDAKQIVSKITDCFALGLVELDDDGEYKEWLDDDGESIEQTADQ